MSNQQYILETLPSRKYYRKVVAIIEKPSSLLLEARAKANPFNCALMDIAT